MKKIFSSLPFRLLVAIVIGGAIGIWAWSNRNMVFATDLMQVIVCAHRLMGQFVSFCVPLIVLGFICPSITKMGQNAGKLLGVALVIAYLSSILAATMSAAAGYALVPSLGINTAEAFERELPKAIFTLEFFTSNSLLISLTLAILFFLMSIPIVSK